jgi:VWFA-related protein
VKNAVSHTVIRIVESLGADDQAFLMSFSTATERDLPLTNDHAAVLSALRRLKPAAGTRFYDATITALDELSRSKRDHHKALIIVTDGADHYSQHTFRELLKTARLYGYAINVIGYDGDDSRSWTTAGRQEIRTELEQLGAATGGQVFFPSDEAEAKAVVEQMLELIHSTYRLSFYTSQPASEFWDVEIRIRNRPDLTVFPSLPEYSKQN